jgi:long-subunit fatty acid transport protein
VNLRGALLALGAVVALASSAEATNGSKPISVGARAAGRGGVDYAYADDAMGPATNPAGMAFSYGNRLDQVFAVVDPRVEWTNEFGSHGDRAKLFIPVPAYGFGVTLDPSKSWEVGNVFRLGTWGLDKEPTEEELAEQEELTDEEFLYGSRVRVGFGIFPITGGKIQLKDLKTNGFNSPLDWETDILTLSLTPSIAVRINEYFSVGLNLQAIYSKFELDGGIAQPRFILSDNVAAIDAVLSTNRHIQTRSDIDDASTWGFSWRIGFQFHPVDWWTIGLVYQDRTYSADYLGRVTVDATDEVTRISPGGNLNALVLLGINPALGFNGEYDLRLKDYEQPRQFGLGMALTPHERFSFGFDYTFIRWSEIGRQFKARLTNGDNSNLDVLTGPTVNVRVPLNLRDQHVIALGASVLAVRGADIIEGYPSWELILRLGYNWAKSATPGDSTLPQVPTISEHHIAGGFTFRFGPLVELTAAAEYAFENTVRTTPFHEGDESLNNSRHTVSIMFIYLGLGVRF